MTSTLCHTTPMSLAHQIPMSFTLSFSCNFRHLPRFVTRLQDSVASRASHRHRRLSFEHGLGLDGLRRSGLRGDLPGDMLARL